MSTATRSRAARVAEEIQAEILSGNLATGDRLGLRTELIERFGVSPSVMNEALHILRERGVLTVRPGVNGGVFVADQPAQVRLGAIDVWFAPTVTGPEKLFEARTYLDDLFAGVALGRATPEDMRAMEWALHEMNTHRDDPRGHLESIMRLHLAIAKASRVEVLIGLYESILALLRTGMTRASFVGKHEEMVTHSLQVHADLVGAIRDGDQVLLAKVLELHRRDTDRACAPPPE
jgi:DNA-binding FadR family transcriptional regulator